MTDLREATPAPNPYAPTANIDAVADSLVRVSRLEVFAKVTLAVAILGSVAGLLTAAWMLIFEFPSPSSAPGYERLAIALWIGGMICGAVTAFFGFFSLVLTPLVMLTFGRHAAFGGNGWDRQSVSNFARLSGFLTGFLPTLILSRLELGVIGYGSLVGLFFALASPSMIPRLLRKVDANLTNG